MAHMGILGKNPFMSRQFCLQGQQEFVVSQLLQKLVRLCRPPPPRPQVRSCGSHDRHGCFPEIKGSRARMLMTATIRTPNL